MSPYRRDENYFQFRWEAKMILEVILKKESGGK